MISYGGVIQTKKLKDLNGLIEGLCELKKINIKIPPIGLEFIAPLLINFAEEINKIISLLSGILNIKTTFINTVDTVRDYKINLMNVQQMIQSNNNSVSNFKSNVTPIKIMPNIENKVKSLRQNGICDNVTCIIDNVNKNKVIIANKDMLFATPSFCVLPNL